MHGHCTCGAVRYRLTDRPLFTHCCHCTWCQRETGSAFALNAMIETDRVDLLAGAPEEIVTPSASGKGQIILRCPSCHVALWSHYAGSGRRIAFVRVGTLEDPAACPPDVHIFTATRLPWVQIPAGARVYEAFYRRSEIWPPESLARRAALMADGPG
ncbi:GFA family protein [Solirhodobacter olei]|uniref:GFA family protein n=1 Tax=Solirhodobacter olei TaxID=2493082 RepID=UPI000FDC942E|nr:GFA family protein [Solirhodobacter olei]